METVTHPEFHGEPDAPAWLMAVPFWMNWVTYKGEVCVCSVNYDKSLRAHRPIMDIHYCMTKALNNVVMKSVNWNLEHFKAHKFDDKITG